MSHILVNCNGCNCFIITFIRGKRSCEKCQLLFCDKCISSKNKHCVLCNLKNILEYNRVVQHYIPSKPIKIPEYFRKSLY